MATTKVKEPNWNRVLKELDAINKELGAATKLLKDAQKRILTVGAKLPGGPGNVKN